jgi:hypothetical protein
VREGVLNRLETPSLTVGLLFKTGAPDLSQNAERPRILVAGDAAAPTGFARVVEGIFRPLAAAYEIHQLGANYRGDPHTYPWKVYPAELDGDRWGAKRIVPLVEKLKPTLVFILNDIWVQHAYLKELASMRARPPLVLYCHVDGGPIDAESIEPLAAPTVQLLEWPS